MFYQEHETKVSSPLNARTLGFALVLHAGLFLLFWVAAKIIYREPDVIIPIDMTIVPPWAEQDPDDPNPDPNPPPKEEPKPVAKPKPAKPDPPPKLEPDQDAVEKIVEKKPKKKEFKKGELKKPEEKKPDKKDDKPKKPEFKRSTKLIKNPPPVKLPPGKGTSRDKPLSQAEIMKALAAGARFGASNQLAPNEESRCVSLISRRFYEVWDLPGGYEGHTVQITVRFGAAGKITGFRIAKSSGIAALDQSVLAAAKRADHVNGLSADFLQRYPEITIEMKPDSK